jgi:hypothetical protein
MKTSPKFTEFSDAKPVAIVGIYLTELDFIMVKIKLSNGVFLNRHIGNLNDLTENEYKEIPRDLQGWRFVPCCE